MTNAGEWHVRPERGSLWSMRIAAWLYRWVGAACARGLLYPIIAYFFLTAGSARRSSLEYLWRLHRSPGGAEALGSRPGWRMVFRHFMEFGHVTVDRLGFWLGRHEDFDLTVDGMEHLERVAREGRGALIIGCHLGSFDAMRLVANLRSPISVNVLMYTQNAPRINTLLASLQGSRQSMNVRAIQMQPGSSSHALEAKACIDRGEVVAILGDRLPPNGSDRTVSVRFLGELARLPQGPILLASLLGCPVLFMVGLRTGVGRYRIEVERFADGIRIGRAERPQKTAEYAQRYADRLAHHCLASPLQWFNFYDFWERPEPCRD